MPSALAFLQIGRDERVLQRIAARRAVPFRRVEFYALQPICLEILVELVQPQRALARVEAPVQDHLVGTKILQRRAQLRRVEAVEIEIAEIDRQHDRHVAIAVLEQVLGRALRPVIVEALALPALVRRRHGDMGAPERVDEGLSPIVAPVLRPRIPDMRMRVDDEDPGAFRRDIHFRVPSSFGRTRRRKPSPEMSGRPHG